MHRKPRPSGSHGTLANRLLSVRHVRAVPEHEHLSAVTERSWEDRAGKTTLLNCLTAAIPSRERVVTAEEVFELDRVGTLRTPCGLAAD